jgi:hypothetical protein
MGRSRKPLSAQVLRGFESPSLRHLYKERKICGDVAQLGEHLVRNEGVGGSNPLISTIFASIEVVLDGEVAVPSTRNPLQRGRIPARGRAMSSPLHAEVALMVRSHAMASQEPRQDRKVAAVIGFWSCDMGRPGRS